MEKNKKNGIKFLAIIAIMMGLTNYMMASSCSSKLFSVTIDNTLDIGDVIDNLADTCGLTVVVNDEMTKLRMKKKLYYVKLRNSTLNGFLNTILKDNDLNYSLKGNKLKISYLITRTFRIHYISGARSAKSTANVTIANSNNAAGAVGGASSGGASSSSKTGISIESTDEFKFWKTIKKELERVLIGTADSGMTFTKVGSGWKGADETIWAYNPLEPIINPEAGMVTISGTQRQINRVARYIHTLTSQLKSQVLIDMRIISVSFDDSTTSGVDWGQLYSLQNFTVNSLGMAQSNIESYTFDTTGIIESTFSAGAAGGPTTSGSAKVVNLTGSTKVSDVVKFLSTQGNVKSISSPRIMTLNNQPALISVGKELFYKIKSSTSVSGGGGAAAAEGELVDSVFAGILLDITPEIDTNGYVTLKVNPSISDTIDTVAVSGGVRNIPPDLIRRQIASVIKVKDGEHAILGGLITSKNGTESNKVPLLGDIPFLGKLFTSTKKINTVDELVLIITPHIIKNSKSLSLKDLGYSKLNEK